MQRDLECGTCEIDIEGGAGNVNVQSGGRGAPAEGEVASGKKEAPGRSDAERGGCDAVGCEGAGGEALKEELQKNGAQGQGHDGTNCTHRGPRPPPLRMELRRGPVPKGRRGSEKRRLGRKGKERIAPAARVVESEEQGGAPGGEGGLGRAVAGGAGGALAVLVAVSAVRAMVKAAGARKSLTKRGLLGEERATATQKQYEKQTKRMPTMDLPELSDEEREAARRRRAASRVTDPEQVQEELSQMQVPSNHPWASASPPAASTRFCLTARFVLRTAVFYVLAYAAKEQVDEEQQRRREQQLLEMNQPLRKRDSST